jgi:hypothetical protein
MQYFESGKELLTSIPITGGSDANGADPYKKVCIFRSQEIEVKLNDIIQIASYGEATNDRKYNVMFAWNTRLEDAKGKQLLELTEAKGYNITPDMHHGVFTDVGIIKIPKDIGKCFVSTYVYAASYRASAGHTLKIEQDYGKLSGIIY